MSRKNEIRVGVTVVAALLVTVLGVTWLREFTLGRKARVWHVRFTQTGGLGASDEVQVNGIRKGAVSKIDLVGDHVIVDLALATDVALTTDCKVAIRNVGLMGEKVIAVDMHMTGNPVSERDTILGVFENGMGEVMASVGNSTESIDRVVLSLDALTKRLEKSGDIDKTVTNLRETSEQLSAAMKENRALLHETVVNASQIAKMAKSLTVDREEQYKRTLDAAERSMQNVERLSSRLDSLRGETQKVIGKLDHGDGTLGLMLNDRKLYDDLRGSVASLNVLLADIKLHPRKYINLSIF